MNVFFFFATFVLGNLGATFPDGSKVQIFMWQIAGASFIAGCTVSAAKMVREDWDLPAAGFTMLAIAYGIYYSAIVTPTESQLPVIASGVYMLIPAMFLISLYRGFPLWVRIFGLIACIPFTTVMVFHNLDIQKIGTGELLFNMSFILIDFTGLLWGIFFYRNYRRGNKI
ncbi:MAG: hypothetical protein ACHQM6_04010 [Candidatus Kapaibacterium sp.]